MRGSDFSLPSPLFKHKGFFLATCKRCWSQSGPVHDTSFRLRLCCSVRQKIRPLAVVFPLFLSHPCSVDLFAELFQFI